MGDATKSKDDQLAKDMASLREEIPEGPHKKGIGIALEGGWLVAAIAAVVLVVAVMILAGMILTGAIR